MRSALLTARSGAAPAAARVQINPPRLQRGQEREQVRLWAPGFGLSALDTGVLAERLQRLVK